MGRPKYHYEKRQKELAKKKKHEEKKLRKIARQNAAPGDDSQDLQAASDLQAAPDVQNESLAPLPPVDPV